MEKEKPRLARLTAIITQLQSKRLVTAADIAKKHDVSIRTVYRDIRTLERSGIPILTEEGKGYKIMEGFRIPPIMFTEEEANALIIAEQIIQKNKDASLIKHYESVVTKIKSVLKYTQQEKGELLIDRIQVRDNTKNEITSSYLIQLQSAISNYRVLKIDYLSLGKTPTHRAIEPFALYTTQNNWVLIAFCHLRNDFRAFRLDCIQKLQSSSEHFEPHQMTLQEYLERCREKYLNTPDISLTQG